jgi:hypothetical protein
MWTELRVQAYAVPILLQLSDISSDELLCVWLERDEIVCGLSRDCSDTSDEI